MRDDHFVYRSPVAELLSLLEEELTETGRVAHLVLKFRLGNSDAVVEKSICLQDVTIDISRFHPPQDPVNSAVAELCKWIRQTRSSVWGMPTPKE
jgi:hypothetical protein